MAGIIVGILLVSTLAYLALPPAGEEDLTPAKLKAQGNSVSGASLRVKGKVAAGSVQWDSQNRVMRFALTDGQETLKIVYRGMVPDNFKPGAELVVEGRYAPDAEFEALNFPSRSLCNWCH